MFDAHLFIIIAIAIIMSLLLYYWLPNRRRISYKGRILSRVNHVRNKHKLKALGRVRLLDELAVEHSKYMARNKTCNHDNFDHRKSRIFLMMGLSRVGENCYKFPAKHYHVRVAAKLVDGWLKSPGHRVNILDSAYRRTGIGIAVNRGYVYATQLFVD